MATKKKRKSERNKTQLERLKAIKKPRTHSNNSEAENDDDKLISAVNSDSKKKPAPTQKINQEIAKSGRGEKHLRIAEAKQKTNESTETAFQRLFNKRKKEHHRVMRAVKQKSNNDSDLEQETTPPQTANEEIANSGRDDKHLRFEKYTEQQKNNTSQNETTVDKKKLTNPKAFDEFLRIRNRLIAGGNLDHVYGGDLSREIFERNNPNTTTRNQSPERYVPEHQVNYGRQPEVFQRNNPNNFVAQHHLTNEFLPQPPANYSGIPGEYQRNNPNNSYAVPVQFPQRYLPQHAANYNRGEQSQRPNPNNYTRMAVPQLPQGFVPQTKLDQHALIANNLGEIKKMREAYHRNPEKQPNRRRYTMR